MMDTNGNGQIDNIEFELALLTEEDLGSMLKVENNVDEGTIKKSLELLNKFL